MCSELNENLCTEAYKYREAGFCRRVGPDTLRQSHVQSIKQSTSHVAASSFQPCGEDLVPLPSTLLAGPSVRQVTRAAMGRHRTYLVRSALNDSLRGGLQIYGEAGVCRRVGPDSLRYNQSCCSVLFSTMWRGPGAAAFRVGFISAR